MAFWWPWPPFGVPKHLQNETQKGAKDTSYQKVKIELSLQPELDPEGCGGAENHHFFDEFLEHHFGMVSGTHFGDFGTLLGSLLAPTEAPFGTPFLMFSRGFLGRGSNALPPKTLFLRAHGEDYRRGTGHQPR